MNPMAVLSCVLAGAAAAPSHLAQPLAFAHAQPLAYAAAQPLAYAAAQPLAYAAHVPAPISVPAPYSTQQISGADITHHSQAPAVITKSLTYGSKDFVSGHISAIHKPAIPDFRIQVPTALKGTISHNAPLVKTIAEPFVVNEPVAVVKNIEVPFDVPVYKEQIIEVPTPVHHIKPVAVRVPYNVPGKQYVNTKYTAPVVHRTHSHHVAQPQLHLAQQVGYAQAQPGLAYAQHQGAAYAYQSPVAAIQY